MSSTIKGSGVRNVGFIWSTGDPRLSRAKAATTVSTRVGSTSVDFVWDAKLARYVRTVDGQRVVAASGALVAKPNVLVQYCQINPDPPTGTSMATPLCTPRRWGLVASCCSATAGG